MPSTKWLRLRAFWPGPASGGEALEASEGSTRRRPLSSQRSANRRQCEDMPEAETAALDLSCAECGHSPRAGETWRVLFADIGEAVTYCPECAEREFGISDS